MTEKTAPYSRDTDTHLAEIVASAIAAKHGANPDAPGFIPNLLDRPRQATVSRELIQDAINIISGFDTRQRISTLVQLNDQLFFADVQRVLGRYR